MIKDVGHRSVLEPLLFNLYLNDLFYLAGLTKVFNFADDTKFHACDNSNLENLNKRLEHGAILAIELFETNNMKLNTNIIS